MKMPNKWTLVGFAVWLLTSISLVYAANNITALTQTATTWDKITATWVNAVNTSLSASAGGGSIECTYTYTTSGSSIYACVNITTWKTCIYSPGWGPNWDCSTHGTWNP